MTTVLVILVVLVVAAGAIAWFGGWVGESDVSTIPDAEVRLDQIVEELSRSGEASGSERPVAGLSDQGPSPLDPPSVTGPSAPARGGAHPNPAILDAAIPGALAFAGGAIDWLTPDHAAMVALSQATHTEITNAFDLHRTLAEQQYQLLSEGSLTNWSGHVAEAQIAEQIDSWAGSGTADLADNSNFAGADVSFFDRDFQVKFYSDFNDIDNVHGDVLIVNADAANIPSDALHIDFSEPFDPSLLDGHDVIVAEGLTLAGADDAWESAAGLGAGGLDAGDALDAAGDAFVPGIGSAVRIGMSGYKRREALRDPALRNRATGRVARDAVYGLAGAGTGYWVGTLLGGLVDVASLGMTGGAGSVVGGLVGAGYGGKKAGDASRAADKKAVEDAQERAAGALAEYGLAVDAAQARAEGEWSQAISGADTEAARLASIRLAQSSHIEQLMRRDLAGLRTMSRAEADEMMLSAGARVRAVQEAQRSPRARRRQQQWVCREVALRDSIDSGAGIDLYQVLVLVVASPNGDEQASLWLRDRMDRRAAVIVTADRLMSALQRQSLVDRLSLTKSLNEKRSQIQAETVAILQAPIRTVEERVDQLKAELVVAGYLTSDDAERLGHPDSERGE